MNKQRTQTLITLRTPLGEVTAYGIEFIDDDGDVCLDSDSETLIRLFQAKEFVDEIRRGVRDAIFSGQQVAYLTALTSVSLLDLERSIGMTKARWSQVKKEGDSAVVQPCSAVLANFFFRKIVEHIAAQQMTEQFPGFEDYATPLLRLRAFKQDLTGWQPVLRKRSAPNFSHYKNTPDQERKLA